MPISAGCVTGELDSSVIAALWSTQPTSTTMKAAAGQEDKKWIIAMLDRYPCPVCRAEKWSPIETFVYSRTDGLQPGPAVVAQLWRKLRAAGRTLLFARPRSRPVRCPGVNPYQLLRRRVLFEVWFPDRDVVSLTAAYCRACGFTAYSPRPADEDVAAKYAFIKQHEPDIGGQAGYDPRARRSDFERGLRIYERCVALLGSRNLRVLDYGGGNGKLMQPFVDAGHSCHLIDYNDQPIPGVTKICDDMDSFVGDDTFGLIVCSHVLEHVSDLGRLVSFLHRHLDHDGLLYAEVPQELWAGLRLEADPVTHINFFTTNSFTSLLALNGFDVVESRRELTDYGRARMETVWALGRPRAHAPGAGELKQAPGLSEDARPLLYPSRLASLRRMYHVAVAPRLGRRLRQPARGARPR